MDIDEDHIDGLGKYSFRIVNGVPGLYSRYENDSDEPRIGGYPDNIITSENEMLEFIKTGYTDEDGKHYKFYFEPGRGKNISSH
jgi:hypothetical protein